MTAGSIARLRARARARTPAAGGLPALLDGTFGPAEADELARCLGALADPVRLRIVALLAQKGEMCSCDLTAPLGRSQPTISHHTSILQAAGLLVGERRGRWMWWRLDEACLEALRRALGG